MKLVYDVKYTNSKAISLSSVTADAEVKADLTDGIRRAEITVAPEYHTETKIEDKKEVEFEVDNKDIVTAEIVKLLDTVSDYKVSVHECRHEEGINTPCGQWQVVAEKGKLEAEEIDKL